VLRRRRTAWAGGGIESRADARRQSSGGANHSSGAARRRATRADRNRIGAGGAAGDVTLHLDRARDVELVVEIGLQQVGRGSPRSLSCGAARRSRAAARAHASRDITVPSGTSMTAAISLYVRPSISRRTIISRTRAAAPRSPPAPWRIGAAQRDREIERRGIGIVDDRVRRGSSSMRRRRSHGNTRCSDDGESQGRPSAARRPSA
jgi:hypothetical protein